MQKEIHRVRIFERVKQSRGRYRLRKVSSWWAFITIRWGGCPGDPGIEARDGRGLRSPIGSLHPLPSR